MGLLGRCLAPLLAATAACHPPEREAPLLAGFAGRVVVLPERSEALTADAEAQEVATVEQTLEAFQWEALRYREPGYRVTARIVLDPELASEETGHPTAGVCFNESRTVILNRDLWRAFGEAEREAVLFHELGHCELDRRHTEGRLRDGRPRSLMNRGVVADAAAVAAERAFYVNELFTTRQPPPRVRIGARGHWPSPP